MWRGDRPRTCRIRESHRLFRFGYVHHLYGQFVYTKQNLIYAKPFSKNILEEIVAYADENYRQVMFGGETKVAGSLTIRLSQSPVMQRYLRFVPKKFPVGVLKIAAAIQSKSKCQTVSVSGYFAGTNLSVHYAESRIRERKAKAKTAFL